MSDFDQTFENVSNSFKNHRLATQHGAAAFSRKKLLLSILRLSQLVYERKSLSTLRSALESLFGSLENYLGQGRDLEEQRSLVVYNSKPLINVLLQHREVIEEVYSHNFLFSHRVKAFTFKHGLAEMFSKLNEVAEGEKGPAPELIPDKYSTLCFLARQS